jgi:hypothetical protein
MHSSIIGKIDKARRYSEEKDRVSITSLRATFQGDHNAYAVDFESGSWHCECRSFLTRGMCSHTMALQRMLEEMLVSSGDLVPAI